GDIHNLFGDTDAVNVRLEGDSYRFERSRRGDTSEVMLDYVGYDLGQLRARYAAMVADSGMSGTHAEELATALENGLTGYTYLADSSAS
ncbi:MAG: arginine decarboxylase, partial [Xanthomonadales bacterium]|nr:arginine decarboxylase [Xanthomonadales bacterium]